LRFKRDRDLLLELVDWLQEEHGPVTEDERAAAFQELEDLDAEHEQRRATGKHNASEAARRSEPLSTDSRLSVSSYWNAKPCPLRYAATGRRSPGSTSRREGKPRW
jgi:hypothetical protein